MQIVFQFMCGVSAIALLLACSNGPHDSDVDASIDSDVEGYGDGDVEGYGDQSVQVEPPAPPELPELPLLPMLTPCPPGWREVPPDDPTDPYDVTTCDPWPEGGRQECTAVDEAHFPGEPECTRVGAPCPAGDWTDPPDADATVLYVKVGATPGGDGTQTAPFGTIAEAMAVAAPGTVVALSKGTFDEEVTMAEGVTLWGACVAETLVTCSEPFVDATSSVITSRSSDTSVRNLRVSGNRVGIRAANANSELHIEDIVVVGAMANGIGITRSARLTGRSVVVRDTASFDGLFGTGLEAGGRASLELERAVFERNRLDGLMIVETGTSAVLSDIAVVDTMPEEGTDWFGRGLEVGYGALVEVRRAVFERNHSSAISIFNPGTSVTLEDVIARETQYNGPAWAGYGIEVMVGSSLAAQRLLVEDCTVTGVNADGMEENDTTGVEVTFSDVVVRNTRADPRTDLYGYGLNLIDNASVDAQRILVENSAGVGIMVSQEDTTARFDGFVVIDTRLDEDEHLIGRGVEVAYGARLDISAAVFARNAESGIAVFNPGTSLNLEGALFEWNGGFGIHLGGEGALLTANDVIIRDTLTLEPNQRYGRGIEIGYGAQGVVHRALLERNHEMGVGAFNTGTVLTLEDVEVRETLQRPCANTTCMAEGFGSGVVSLAGAHIEVNRFVIADNSLCGAQLAYGATWDGESYDVGGSIDLHEGVISGNLFGANVQTDDFDIGRLMDHVIWRDNFRNIDSTEMPLPDLSPPSGL